MHHIFAIEDIATLNSIVWTELRKHGIKEAGRARKPTRNNENQKKCLFNQPLELLESELAMIMVETELEKIPDSTLNVYAKGDILVQVPQFVVQSCQAILNGVQTEGLFRKAGSACRQREVKRQLEKGEGVKPAHDVIDLANILKQFLRELPEPLIPIQLHDIFFKAIQLETPEKVARALHLICLLIPPSALATLCYLLQFFETVASNSSKNLMDASNLSIVMAPTLMPININASTRNDRQNCTKLQNSAKVIQLLIENSRKLCAVPQYIACRLGSMSTSSLVEHDRGRRTSRDNKRRNRRSSSFNRVFEGLRKIVGVKSELSASTEQLNDGQLEPTTEPPPTSPVIRNPVKRKVDGDANVGLSIKKKKAVADSLPQKKVLCTTPLTPQGNHRYVIQTADTHHSYFASPRIDLNPSPSGHTNNLETNKSAAGVLRFFHRKKLAGRNEETSNPGVKTPKATKRRLSIGKKALKKAVVEPLCEIDKHPSAQPVLETTGGLGQVLEKTLPSPVADHQVPEENYDVVHQHYEELKFNVKVLEREIGVDEPQNIYADANTRGRTKSGAFEVQDQYEKTLEESEKLLLERSATEQLARQLSRGLRIRRSAEQRVIRSPSARKIGAIRRRSRESPIANLTNSNASVSSRRLTRSQSMLAIRRHPSVLVQQIMVTPKRLIEPLNPTPQEVKISLRRGKPNTIRTGLKDPTPMRVQSISRSARNSPAGDETPRASKPRATVSSEGAASSSSDKQTSSAAKRTINRNGSVMKLAQNFAAITQSDEICRRRGYRVSSSTALNSVADSPVEFATPESGQQQWTSGEILNRHLDHLRIPLTGRPSVQKIRSENQGKVSAHVRKFDRLASPTFPDPAETTATIVDPVASEIISATPHRLRSPRQCAAVQRRLSSEHKPISKERATPPKIAHVSPLRESQRVNAITQSTKPSDPKIKAPLLQTPQSAKPSELKIKAPLLTPSQATATPFGLKLRTHETRNVRLQKKPSPLRATAPLLRRSPRFVPTPN